MSRTRSLITGGAGFIGSNLAAKLIREGHELTILDNLSRAGCAANLDWLRSSFGDGGFEFIRGDITDGKTVSQAVRGKQQIYHLAGQVAVTKSLQDPRSDFESNALGTFNMLEAARECADDPIFVYASTNKVYGRMEGLAISETAERYEYRDLPFGVPESQSLDFHSPYGCSKGAGDQYVRDYARIYHLRTVVARQSCIYGCRQLGVEDQGWLAWFVITALRRRAVTIFGNGKQVRDVLFIEDLLDAYQAITRNIDISRGQVYNIGGGPANTMSIWTEFGPLLESLTGYKIATVFKAWRPGDQPVYVSDIRKAQRELGWRPATGIREGVQSLFAWVRDNQELFSKSRPITSAPTATVQTRRNSAAM